MHADERSMHTRRGNEYTKNTPPRAAGKHPDASGRRNYAQRQQRETMPLPKQRERQTGLNDRTPS
jgi:hypothetical protein